MHHVQCSKAGWGVHHVHTRPQHHPDARDGHKPPEHGDDRILDQRALEPSGRVHIHTCQAHLGEIALGRSVPLGLAADEHGLDQTLEVMGHMR